MNKAQKIVIGIGTILFLIIGLFPPSESEEEGLKGIFKPAKIKKPFPWIFETQIEIDWSRLMLLWVILLVVVIGLVLILRGTNLKLIWLRKFWRWFMGKK